MLELKRIYWTRLGLRLAFAATTVWLFASAVLALMPQATTGAMAGPSSVTEVLRGMFDRVVAAVTLPGLIAVVLVLVAAVINARDVRRRDPVRHFTRQQRREGKARAGGQCEMEAGFRRRCSRPAEHGDHFYPWSKGGSTSVQNSVAACSRCNRAKGARGSRHLRSRKGRNDDGGPTSRSTVRWPSASGSRCPNRVRTHDAMSQPVVAQPGSPLRVDVTP